MMNRSIRFQMLALAALTAGPILALVGGNLWFQWQSDRAAAIEQAIGDARLLAAQVDDHIGNLDNLLLGLSRAVSTNAADMTANDRLLRKLKSELPNFISNIQLFSLEGVSIGSSLEGERTVVVDRPYFQQVISEKRLVIGDVIRARGTNEWIVVIARPVEDQGGRLRAVLAIGTRLEQIQSIVRIEQFPKDTVLRIVDQRGIVVTQSANGPNWIGRDLSTSEIIKRHLAAKEASEVVEWSDGISRVTGSATAHRAPWLVSIGLPSSIQFERVASKLYWHACLICVVLLVAFGTAWFISGRITRPLRQLQTDALILAQGQLNHRTSVSRRDEIGTLAVTFNQMATAVERRDDETRHAANELRRTQGFLDAVIENIPTMLFVKDPKDCRFILINNAGEKLLGYSRTSLIGKNDYDFFPKEEADLFIEKDRRALQSGKLEIIEEEPIHTKTNGLRFLRTKKMPIMGQDGKPQYLLGLSEDITEQKRLQETERQAKETLAAVIDASPVAIICLAQTDSPPELLELEITENIALGHDEKILAQLRALKTLGVGLAFDDFGTGYASLSYLTNYPLTRVKIDQSFVRKITDKSRPEELAIVRSIISMAQNLNLAVTAEGVETNQQLAFLRAAKCEEAQGYLYAKPLPAAEFVEFVRASHLGTRIQSMA